MCGMRCAVELQAKKKIWILTRKIKENTNANAIGDNSFTQNKHLCRELFVKRYCRTIQKSLRIFSFVTRSIRQIKKRIFVSINRKPTIVCEYRSTLNDRSIYPHEVIKIT